MDRELKIDEDDLRNRGWVRSKSGRGAVQESACEDNGDLFQKYKACDMIGLAL